VLLTLTNGVRVSRIYEAGGELVYGFGYFDGRGLSLAHNRPRVYASSQHFNVNTV
jgi:hypothetical protein